MGAGGRHTVALKSDGTIWTWGGNFSGEIGDGPTINRLSPMKVPGLSGVTAIVAGGHHAMALFTPTVTSSFSIQVSPSDAAGKVNLGRVLAFGLPSQAQRIIAIPNPG